VILLCGFIVERIEVDSEFFERKAEVVYDFFLFVECSQKLSGSGTQEGQLLMLQISYQELETTKPDWVPTLHMGHKVTVPDQERHKRAEELAKRKRVVSEVCTLNQKWQL